MNKLTKKITLLASVLAVAGMFANPALAAANAKTKTKKQVAEEAANLKKYDTNRNGKLDPKEEAEMQADQEKAKVKKKKTTKPKTG